MTRERVAKPVAPLQRAPDTAPKTRASSRPVQLARLPRTLEAKPATQVQLEIQRAQQLEVQRLADLEGQRAAIQRAHDDRFTSARALQSTWRSSSLKSVGVQRAASDHSRNARAASQARATFVAQRSTETLETLVAQRLELQVRPALPTMQRQADLTLSHVADHLGSKATVQLARDPERLSSYAGFKNTGASLVKSFRTPGSSHTMPQLASAIQRFREPMQRAAVEGAVYAAFGSHPTYPKQLQRALEERDQQLEVQRESWQRELEPVAQRQALEEASGEGAAQQIESARGSGQPLPAGVRAMLETKWNTDLSKVRVHTDARSSQISKKLNAKALTTGQDIFFGASTFNPTSLEGLQLIAHEAWHTVQQAGGLVQAGVDKSASLEVEARGKGAELSSGDVQTASSNAPRATRTDANASIRQAVVGNLISRTASPEWRALTASVWGDPASSQSKLFEQDAYTQNKRSETTAPPSSQSVPPNQVAPTGLKTDNALSAAPRATGIRVQRSTDGGFTVQRESLTVQRFGVGDAISSALGNLPGYKELCAVFGKDLVTGSAVQANPNAILDKLSSFVPGPLKDMVKALRETNAIPKAWAWFKAELKKINIGAAWNNVKKAIGDASVFSPGESIDRVKAAVMQPINQLKALIAGSIKKLAEIALEAIGAGFGPAAKPIIDGLKGAGSVLGEVFKNPGKFIGNLVSAVKGGFKNFTKNAQKHLATGAGQWLTGESGIAFPQHLDLKGVFTVVLSVLGISYVNFRKSLVKKLGEDKTKIAESKVDMVQNLMSKGMGAAEGMKAHEGAVKNEVIDGIKTEVKNSVIQTAVLKLVSMFVPGGGLVQLFITAFDMVKFFMSEGQRIFSLISSVMQSVAAIASGNISAAVAGVETSLAKSIPVALSFMSRIFKVSGIGTKVKAIINRVKGRIEQVVSKVMDKAAALVAKMTSGTATSSKPGAKPATTKPVSASRTDPKTQLATAIAAVKPELSALSKRNAPVSELKAKLAAWQTKHQLSRVWMTKESGEFKLMLKVNPEGSVGQNFIPDDATLRVATREAVQDVMKSPKILARAKQYKQQMLSATEKVGQGASAAKSPFQVSSGLDTLALIVYSRQTPVTADNPISGRTKPEKGQTSQAYDYGTNKPVSASQMHAGTNEFVRGAGTYKAHVVPVIAAIKLQTRQVDADIAADIQTFIRNGRWPVNGDGQQRYSDDQKQKLATIRHLITFTESVRSPDNPAHAMMLIDLVASGQATWSNAIEKLPMHVQRAAGLKRGLEVMDRGLESISPKMAAFIRKFTPDIQKMRDMEANLVREWLQKSGGGALAIFEDKVAVRLKISSEMKKGYGV